MSDNVNGYIAGLFLGISVSIIAASLVFLKIRNRQRSVLSMIVAEIDVNITNFKTGGFPYYVQSLPSHISFGEEIPIPDLLDNTAVIDGVYRSVLSDIASLQPSLSGEICRFYAVIYGIQSTLKKLSIGIDGIEPEQTADILVGVLNQWREAEAIAEIIRWERHRMDSESIFGVLLKEIVQPFKRGFRSKSHPS